MNRTERLCLVLAAAAALVASSGHAEIVSTSFRQVDSLDLTAAGTLDWAVFGHGIGKDSLKAVDFKRGGAAIELFRQTRNRKRSSATCRRATLRRLRRARLSIT